MRRYLLAAVVVATALAGCGASNPAMTSPGRPGPASVGVNVSPGWGDTVDGRNLDQMERVLLDFQPKATRMPWANNANEIAALKFDAQHHIDSVVIDDPTKTPEQVVSEITQAHVKIAAVEGVNEPDVPPTGFTPTQVPLSTSQVADLAARQKRLYRAVAGRWPVLCPSSVYRVNDAALNSMACDIISAHRYAPLDGSQPKPSDAELPKTSKPVWVTETGINTYQKWEHFPFSTRWVVTPDQQADYLRRMTTMLRNNGAARVFIYSLQNTGRDPMKPGNNFGLYTWNGEPKPAARAFIETPSK